MSLLTIDFETYYDKEYSLSKMSTEDYINDPRFEVVLVAVKVDAGEVQWFSGSKKQTADWLAQFPIETSGVVGHNMMFDALILQQQFGRRPGVVFDTMNMAQVHIRPFTKSVSLKACLEYCDFDGLRKGTEVHNMLGRTRKSLSPAELRAYADYCVTDVEGTYALFMYLRALLPKSEFEIIDMTHRMYLDPVIELDLPLLAETLAEERAKKAALMAQVQSICSTDQLMSNDKFAEVLRKLGVDPPKKTSLTTGKETYAFSKSDPEFKQMCEDYEDDEMVSLVINARLGVKSTIKETRTERLLQIAQSYGKLRVPLTYYAAHTGRYGGTQKINMQNPPRVDTKAGHRRQIRYTMKAPRGHVFLAADLAQIEARIVAWLACCEVLLNGFRNKEDVYAAFATQAYGYEVAPKSKTIERFVGKTCILGLGYGMGAFKLKNTLGKEGIKVTDTKAVSFVRTYRDLYREIPSLWREMDIALRVMAQGNRTRVGPVVFGKEMVLLPNNMPIFYHNLRVVGADGYDYCYNFGSETRKIFGGKLTENIVQALARTVVMENMLTIRRELGIVPVLQVHDELDYIVPEGDAARLAVDIEKIMSTPPHWAKDLPVAAEVNYGATFGDCK